nr:MAG TPA: hypothetical protein [Caudoviricetes sp.]
MEYPVASFLCCLLTSMLEDIYTTILILIL